MSVTVYILTNLFTLYFDFRLIKRDICEHLFKLNLLKSYDPSYGESNINSSNTALVRAIICAGLYPNVAVVRTRP